MAAIASAATTSAMDCRDGRPAQIIAPAQENAMKLDSTISAVVTGGASGLGEATARRLASHGVRVALFDLNAERGEALARELGGVFCQANVTSNEELEAAFAKARAAIGQERILVNCAGVGGGAKTVSRDKQTGEIKEYPLENFERIIQVNLIGTFRCITKSAAGMLTLDVLDDGDRGAIVNTASVAAEDGQIGQVAYTASKAGIVGMTLTIARDLAGEAIRINTILPGIFDTPLLARAAEHVKAGLSASVPFPKRLGLPEEYAQLAETMITNGYFNGEDVRLDGAIRMQPR
jgi:NAD(P)-dependent dehydrogenase (short-subunit alcohol dehydrogenase family)